MANQLELIGQEPAPNSEEEADNRRIWDFIWKANVPEKVRIFAWRVATEILAMKKNKWRRTLEVDNICNLCGRETEDEYHAVIACTKARALREEIRAFWDLPAEERFRYTGQNWLQILLGSCAKEDRRKILLLLWRAWWLRDDCVHAKGKATIGHSVRFLVKYVEELKAVDAGRTDSEDSRLGDSQLGTQSVAPACVANKKGKQNCNLGAENYRGREWGCSRVQASQVRLRQECSDVGKPMETT